MEREYRIAGTGGEAAFLEAGRFADDAFAAANGLKSRMDALTWFTHLLAVTGASAVLLWLFLPSLHETFGLPIQIAAFLCLACGIAVYFLVVVLLNRSIAKGTAQSFCNGPMTQNQHVSLSGEGMWVVSGQSRSLLHWSDVTRIERLSKAIVVIAGPSWAYVPVSGFEDEDQAKAALSDMRGWQKAAEA